MNAKIQLILRLALLAVIITACNYPGTRVPAGTPGGAATPTSFGIFPTPTVATGSQLPPVVTATLIPNTGGTPAPATQAPATQPGSGTQVPSTQTGATQVPTTLQGPQAVVFVEQGEVLNVRQAPGIENTVVGSLLPQESGVTLTGREAMAGESRWAEVKLSDGTVGWVNAWYLTEPVAPATFCADPAVASLFANVKTAILNGDGELFASLVSPRHGLTLHYLNGGNVVNYSPEEAKFIFVSDYVTNWGTHPASGNPVEGSFRAEVLPKLQEVLNAQFELTCNDVKTGGASYPTEWPYSYGNYNFYSIYKPGTAGVDLDWRTWLAGVEYVGGKPYIVSLIHFFWEP